MPKPAKMTKKTKRAMMTDNGDDHDNKKTKATKMMSATIEMMLTVNKTLMLTLMMTRQ